MSKILKQWDSSEKKKHRKENRRLDSMKFNKNAYLCQNAYGTCWKKKKHEKKKKRTCF